MRNRRFLLLSAILVTLNVSLLLAPPGLALRQMVSSTLFGKTMVRAEIIENTGCPTSCADWHIDRGVVVSNNTKLSVLTLQEADGKLVPINVSSSTKVTAAGTAKPTAINGIKPG